MAVNLLLVLAILFLFYLAYIVPKILRRVRDKKPGDPQDMWVQLLEIALTEYEPKPILYGGQVFDDYLIGDVRFIGNIYNKTMVSLLIDGVRIQLDQKHAKRARSLLIQSIYSRRIMEISKTKTAA